ncbi:hypothetical protein MYSTI_03073 [Myxococcus stipitatus DSM 14675]|uniref:Uncharacterized protein n=1 Tax=Myxococcus stipitatus (strain DSM 14675 / JCM 12634 / Mx s8) TaxID=1278073 RepID=L7UD51_MYXSD|nr:hypothetical protein [Myxococcus stipitatus]AGC44389.1 hypothetical protein MYSTI_03073 [Myxococcus stipitatus DSM 14675]
MDRYAGRVASFQDALQENRIPPLLGDVRLRYDSGRLVGESLPPRWEWRMLPGLSVAVGVGCAVGAAILVGQEAGTLPSASAALALVAAALVGLALKLESRLSRRRFVLHFRTETLRLERLTWAPSATRSELIAFDAVRAVHLVERPGPRYALLVEYTREGAGPTRALLVEDVRRSESETLHRVWRMLSNAFGLRGAGLAGG